MNDRATPSWPEPPGAGLIGDGRHALASFRPGSVEELRQVVREQAGKGLSLYPQGGGTALNYGGVPRSPGVIVETRALDRVIDYPHADMTITVQAGITAAALRAVLAEKHQRLLIDIPQSERATLGGVYATNTCGPRRFGLGRPRDQIIGVSFVTAAGVEVKGGGRVVKNVAGYDFPKLLTGSLGTLGILTQMTLKVRPLPEVSALVWAAFESLEPLEGVLAALNTSAARPVALEVLGPSAGSDVGKALSLPHGGWILAVGLEDNAASVRWQINQLRTELSRFDLTVREGADTEGVWTALTEFQAAASGPLSATAGVPPSRVVALLRALDPARWSVQAHAGSGVVWMHAAGEWDLARAEAEVSRLRALVDGDGGHLVLARCPTEWKARLGVWGTPRADWRLAERIKRTLDPAGVMNPGRFVGNI